MSLVNIVTSNDFRNLYVFVSLSDIFLNVSFFAMWSRICKYPFAYNIFELLTAFRHHFNSFYIAECSLSRNKKFSFVIVGVKLYQLLLSFQVVSKLTYLFLTTLIYLVFILLDNTYISFSIDLRVKVLPWITLT